MHKITIEEIQESLQKDNWKLLSDTYKNLDTNLEYECNNGHTICGPWKKYRENRICPTCMRENLKVKEFKNTKKKKDEYRILAFDQATHISGYAVFNNKELIRHGSFETIGANDIERCAKVKQYMLALIDCYDIDFVGFEGIQYQAAMGVTTFETLARLQGILMETCYEEKIPFEVVPTNTWRGHCGVKGKSRADKKRSMQLLVNEWFNLQPTEDECDAIGIGKYFCDQQIKKVEIIDWENME